jgi:shikimate dehydrogenase
VSEPRAGCTTLDGLEMLVNQGVISIKLRTGVNADSGMMRMTLEDVFGAEDHGRLRRS